MSQPKKTSSLIAVTVVLMAAFFAASLALGSYYLNTRRNNPPTTATGPADADTTINGKTVQYKVYADEEVILLPVNKNPATNGGSGAAAPSTAVPPTPIPPTAVPPTPEPDKIIFTNYVVQNGDTLYGISDKYGWTTTISLMAKHDIAANHIIPGDTLRLPVANPDYCSGRRPYVVEESESASTIARTAGTTIEILKEINNLDAEYTVYVTDVLCVP